MQKTFKWKDDDSDECVTFSYEVIMALVCLTINTPNRTVHFNFTLGFLITTQNGDWLKSC